jgi:hypothetical protein
MTRTTRDGLFVLGMGLVAVVCCFGISLAVAVGATTLLILAGLALPLAALIGISGWTIWYRSRGRATDGSTRTSRFGKDHSNE